MDTSPQLASLEGPQLVGSCGPHLIRSDAWSRLGDGTERQVRVFLSVENSGQKRPVTAVATTFMVIVVMFVFSAMAATPVDRVRRGAPRLALGCGARDEFWSGSFDDLVKLALIEPDAPAVGAIVDLHALPVGHQQTSSATGAGHSFDVILGHAAGSFIA